MYCGFVWASFRFVVRPWPKKSLVHIKATEHLVLSRGREGRWTQEVFISAARGMSEGLLVTQKCSPHFKEINQNLEGRDCHFLVECWKISLAINLSLSSHVLSLFQLCMNGGKMSQINLFCYMSGSSSASWCAVTVCSAQLNILAC